MIRLETLELSFANSPAIGIEAAAKSFLASVTALVLSGPVVVDRGNFGRGRHGASPRRRPLRARNARVGCGRRTRPSPAADAEAVGEVRRFVPMSRRRRGRSSFHDAMNGRSVAPA